MELGTAGEYMARRRPYIVLRRPRVKRGCLLSLRLLPRLFRPVSARRPSGAARPEVRFRPDDRKELPNAERRSHAAVAMDSGGGAQRRGKKPCKSMSYMECKSMSCMDSKRSESWASA